MDRLIFLERIHAYTFLPESCSLSISASLAKHSAAEGQQLPAQLGEQRDLIMIASGIARVYIHTDDGQDVTQFFVRAEDFVLANFDEPRGAIEHIEAVTHLTYVSLPYSRFEELLVKHCELSIFFAQMLRERGLRARDRAERRARRESVDTYESFLNAYPGLELQVPTAHLASYLGLSPSEFMRARQRYRDRGLM